MTTRDRLLIAICDAIVLQQCGKDVDRARDFDLIKQVFDTGTVPPDETGQSPVETGQSSFEILVERVRAINPDAAEYLMDGAEQLRSFSREGNLTDCFDWSKTPQGYRYWERIHFKLSRE